MITVATFVAMILVVYAPEAYSTSPKQDAIATIAKSKIGSYDWLYGNRYSWWIGENVNKCNLFVADVLKEAGADAPERHWYSYSPIGAWEWADKDSSYLKDDSCWSLCWPSAEFGDVIAKDGHVGIVTGYHKTTSASALASPQGKVVENDWGFRDGTEPTCWRYTCS